MRLAHRLQTMHHLGFGLGLRPQHYEAILAQTPAVDWFEVLSENYMIGGGRPLHYLDRIAERYPIVMHGVSLSIGGSDPLATEYLRSLKRLAQRTKAHWISDHLCWTGVNGVNLHDLMPLPFTEEALQHVAARIAQVQDFLGRRILIENVSSYVTYRSSEMTEWQFLRELTELADCELLLDVNNVYVSSFNHGFSAREFLYAIPPHRVRQMHLAGHQHCGSHIIDTHDAAIADPVWELYAQAVRCFPNASVMIERDGNIPPLDELILELQKARTITAAVREAA